LVCPHDTSIITVAQAFQPAVVTATATGWKLVLQTKDGNGGRLEACPTKR